MPWLAKWNRTWSQWATGISEHVEQMARGSAGSGWSLCLASEWSCCAMGGGSSRAGLASTHPTFCSLQSHPNALKTVSFILWLNCEVKRGCLINRYDHPRYSEEGARKPKSGNPGGRRNTKAAGTHTCKWQIWLQQWAVCFAAPGSPPSAIKMQK